MFSTRLVRHSFNNGGFVVKMSARKSFSRNRFKPLPTLATGVYRPAFLNPLPIASQPPSCLIVLRRGGVRHLEALATSDPRPPTCAVIICVYPCPSVVKNEKLPNEHILSCRSHGESGFAIGFPRSELRAPRFPFSFLIPMESINRAVRTAHCSPSIKFS